MAKRSIRLLLAAISIALIGLVAIQVVWINKTITLKEDQFARGVSNALFSVSERLEQMDRMRDLKRNRSGRRLLQELDSLRAVADEVEREAELEELRAQEEAGIPEEEAGYAHDAPIAEEGSMDAQAPQRMSDARTTDPDELEAMISDLVHGVLGTERRKEIRRRIDGGLLDSLLITEMRQLGADDGVRYGIFSVSGKWVRMPGEHAGTAEELADAPYREQLFRHDMAGPTYYLHAVVPHTRASLFSGMWPMLFASVLFIALIAAGFIFTIRILLRQKRLNDIRNDLVNNLTHELKTPISTISLACEALADPSMPKTEQQVRTFTTMIRDENKRLGALVENVLQSAVQDSGRMVLKPVDLDLHTLIADVVRSSTMQVSRRNGRIDLDLKAEIHGLKADRIHLTNLLYNLIDNAVKYTEQEPRIRIATVSNNEGITMRITDNGIGIAAGEHRKIFDKLYRVPTGNLHNAKGFGLGLSYAKSVVERHGGRITVESTPGQGSTFIIHLPFEHVQARETARR